MKKQQNNEVGEEMPIELQLYFELLKRMYERMEKDNSWPWLKNDNPAE